MTELFFSAVILSGNSPAESVEEKKAAIGRAIDIVSDAGAENLFIAASHPEDRALFPGPILLPAKSGTPAWVSILDAAEAMTGTHLLVLDAGFKKLDATFFVRLMQMSCLGMGVLPFVDGKCEPLAACYPSSIQILAETVRQRILPDSEVFAGEVMAKGLVAQYDVSSRDALLFEKSATNLP